MTLSIQKENGPLEKLPNEIVEQFGNLDVKHQKRMHELVQATLLNINEKKENDAEHYIFLHDRLSLNDKLIEGTLKIVEENHLKNEIFWKQKIENQNVRAEKIEILNQKIKAFQENLNQFEQTNY